MPILPVAHIEFVLKLLFPRARGCITGCICECVPFLLYLFNLLFLALFLVILISGDGPRCHSLHLPFSTSAVPIMRKAPWVVRSLFDK